MIGTRRSLGIRMHDPQFSIDDGIAEQTIPIACKQVTPSPTVQMDNNKEDSILQHNEEDSMKYINHNLNDTFENVSEIVSPSKILTVISAESPQYMPSLHDTNIFLVNSFQQFNGDNKTFISKKSTQNLVRLKCLVHQCFRTIDIGNGFWLFPCVNMTKIDQCLLLSIHNRHFNDKKLCSFCTLLEYTNSKNNFRKVQIKKNNGWFSKQDSATQSVMFLEMKKQMQFY